MYNIIDFPKLTLSLGTPDARFVDTMESTLIAPSVLYSLSLDLP
jgi:hypothetical protein